MRKIILTGFLSLTMSLTQAQEINTARIDSFINHIEQFNQSIGAVAITQAGRYVYHRRFGNADFPRTASQTGDKYRVGSITKLLTATMTHQLFEEGRLRPDETLSDYFPDIPNAEKITIAHLLNHTSGLGDYVFKEKKYFFWATEPLSEQAILAEIKAQGILFQPGDGMKYSNSGYYLLARILEKVYGKPYPQIVQQQIFTPLGMKHTLSGVDEDPGISLSYRLNTQNEWKVCRDFYFPNVVGLGDIASTPDDLNIFLQALFTGKLVSKESVQKMMPVEKQIYGQGIMAAPFTDKTLYGHGGATFGTRSIALYDTDEDIAMSMCVNGVAIPFNEVLLGVVNGIYNKPNLLADYSKLQQYKPDSNSFSQYEGEYASESVPVKIKVYKEGNDLMMDMTGESPAYMEAFDKDVFRLSPSGISLEFKPESGQLFLTHRGKTTEFKK